MSSADKSLQRVCLYDFKIKFANWGYAVGIDRAILGITTGNTLRDFALHSQIALHFAALVHNTA